ncbi:uncharacterized protein si:dkey-195m11.11 [Tachysurus fulvidraco]|uniref:uncharacterized protein si:dkey-195m11.11 n=1 Tax=Tachysurus fulvidraco TaxID=1234273 RepID=UPI001FED4279|nr:uncharacterized protein si:dkey-195m11.11 [Tachysurus fulvidraco]
MKLYTLHTLTALCSVLCWCVFTVQRVESNDVLPAPTLSFDSNVNQSSITLYSNIIVLCTIPNNAKLPVEICLSKADTAHTSTPFTSTKQFRLKEARFSLKVTPDLEGSLVCWYSGISSKVQSQFSERLNITISGLSDPIMLLIPTAFPVGGKYIAQCETPTKGYENTTLKLYDRLLPIRLGKENFDYIGSRVLLPGDWGAALHRTNAGETYEYICEMEVFLNGRTLRSTSEILTAMPEELPVRLIPKDSGQGSCYGYAFLKVRADWRPLCFDYTFYGTVNVANVICRELGCGSAINYEKISFKSPDAIGTPNCTGNEKKVAECPLVLNYCNQGTLNVICSATLFPPKLSVSEHGPVSRIYIRTGESLTLTCIFESSVNDPAYITFTRNGKGIYTTSARPGYTERYTIYDTVPDGEYACSVRSGTYKTENSNVIGIYIYDPPPAGAVAGGVITTLLGVLILVLLCVCRAGSE